MSCVRYTTGLVVLLAVASASATSDWEDLARTELSTEGMSFDAEQLRKQGGEWLSWANSKFSEVVAGMKEQPKEVPVSSTQSAPVQSAPEVASVTSQVKEVVQNVSDHVKETAGSVSTALQDTVQKVAGSKDSSSAPVVSPETGTPWLDTQAVIDAVKAKYSDVKVWTIDNKSLLIKCGVGAIALVTISGVTYVLYKNGTLKKVADVCKKHPSITTAAVGATIATAVAGVYVYYNGTPEFAKTSIQSVKGLCASCVQYVQGVPAQVGFGA